jgi:ABC-type antimicrobial peptide transport system permease subunit
VLRTLVFGVHLADPSTYLVLACLVTAVVVLACAVPAYRATRIEPVIALKD